MASPFPGLDPFIEAQGKWEDFHNKLMGDLERFLSEALPERYAVRLGERSYIEYVNPGQDKEGTHIFKPDVGIKASGTAGLELHGQISLLEATAVDMEGLTETEFHEIFLEIHELDPESRLVTSIEILSPTNKRPGTVGWYQYERKRKVFLEGHANLVEIDLLRGGQRHPMSQPWPQSPYYLLILRKAEAPRCKVWPAGFREPIPPIPVPLAPPDADLVLDLQKLVNGVYERSRYRREIDYTQPLRPALSADDLAWLQTQLPG